MYVKNSIRTLRIAALLLFITPTIGLLGSLIIHNYFVSFNFTHEPNFGFMENTPGNLKKTLCKKTRFVFMTFAFFYKVSNLILAK